MSPLWKRIKVKRPIMKQLTIKQMRPSPKCDYLSFAQSVSFCHSRQIFQSKIKRDSIEGISLFTSRMSRIEASMTVEAAMVLPLFLFFFLNLSCGIELIRLHGNLEFALCDVGNRMAVYAYALTDCEKGKLEEDSELWKEIKDVALSYAYIKTELINYVGDTYLKESPIANGIAGLQLLESELFESEDYFEIIVTYEVEPFSNMVGFGSFRMANRYYGHLWNGYQIPEAAGSQEKDISVYVAENGVVYHLDRTCTHLLLSVRGVSLQEAYESRNMNGERYTPCQRCGNSEEKEEVYITEDGDNIHYRKDCPGLQRTIHTMSLDKARIYRACSRCARN